MDHATPDRQESLHRLLADLEDAYGPAIREARATPGCTDMAINAHPLEKVKRAVSAGGECGNVYFLHPCACPQRRLRQGLISVHQALRKSKCENAAEATGFCTMSLNDCWFYLFEGVGIDSQIGHADPQWNGFRCFCISGTAPRDQPGSCEADDAEPLAPFGR